MTRDGAKGSTPRHALTSSGTMCGLKMGGTASFVASSVVADVTCKVCLRAIERERRWLAGINTTQVRR